MRGESNYALSLWETVPLTTDKALEGIVRTRASRGLEFIISRVHRRISDRAQEDYQSQAGLYGKAGMPHTDAQRIRPKWEGAWTFPESSRGAWRASDKITRLCYGRPAMEGWLSSA